MNEFQQHVNALVAKDTWTAHFVGGVVQLVMMSDNLHPEVIVSELEFWLKTYAHHRMLVDPDDPVGQRILEQLD